MIRKYYFLLLVFTLNALASCDRKSNNEIKAVQIADSLSQYADSLWDDSMSVSKLDISLLTKVNYDSIVVIKPYADLDEVEDLASIKLGVLKSLFREIKYDEMKSVLVFIRNRKMVTYSIVPTRPVDFNALDEDVPIISKKQSKALLLKFTVYNDDKYFRVVMVE